MLSLASSDELDRRLLTVPSLRVSSYGGSSLVAERVSRLVVIVRPLRKDAVACLALVSSSSPVPSRLMKLLTPRRVLSIRVAELESLILRHPSVRR